MVRHICMFKLKEENKEANLKEAFSRLEEVKKIPMISEASIVTNMEQAP